MFGLGFGEIVLIMVVALIVFGPDKMPDVARQMGRFLGEFRRTLDEMKHELNAPRFEIQEEMRRMRSATDLTPELPPPGPTGGTPVVGGERTVLSGTELAGTCEAGCDHSQGEPLGGIEEKASLRPEGNVEYAPYTAEPLPTAGALTPDSSAAAAPVEEPSESKQSSGGRGDE